MILLPVTLLLTLASAHQDKAENMFRFEVEVHTVYVDVFATHDGAPVTDLTASDFEVLDNGVRQEIEQVSPNVKPLSTVFLLDISGSVVGERLNDLRAAAHAFLDGLDARDEAGLLTFTREMRLRKGVSSDLLSVHRALDQPMDAGTTGLNDALFAALKLVEARDGRPLILVFTDGLDNTSWLTESEVLEVVKASEAVIHAVGVKTPQPVTKGIGGRAARRNTMVRAADFLRSITRPTGGRIWSAESTAALKDIYLSILEEMKSSYLLSYQPRGVSREGWHALQVKMKGHRSEEVRARSGYLYAPNRD